MEFNISEFIKEQLSDDDTRPELFYQECTVPAKTILLEAGRISRNFYFIHKGCIRLWFNQDGKEITVQFFFEGQGVASIESFMQDTPSLFSIETIEPTTVWIYDKADIVELMEKTSALKDKLHKLIVGRLINYTHLFLSRIKDTPQQRYENLLKECPEIVKRVPQHYIASYLGITSVSLSRIRNRK